MIRALALLVALAAVAAAVLAVVTGRGERTSTPAAEGATVSEHPVAVPADVRTVFLSASLPMPSAHARQLSAMLEAGLMPETAVAGEVRTDTDCAPDANGISHCRNDVRLADGTMLVLRHPHDMSKVPCLAPGERVRLVPPGL